MFSIIDHFLSASWAVKRAFIDGFEQFGETFGERFVYWWAARGDRRTIDHVESWP